MAEYPVAVTVALVDGARDGEVLPVSNPPPVRLRLVGSGTSDWCVYLLSGVTPGKRLTVDHDARYDCRP